MIDVYIVEGFGFIVAIELAMLGLTNLRYLKSHNSSLPKIIVGLLLAILILGADFYFIVKNNELFYNRKPHCLKNDIQCLERLLEWKKDSVKYNFPVPIKVELDTARILDSLKHELEKY